MSDTNSVSKNASLVGGHAQYVKGAVEEALGSVTGNQSWTHSGVSDKAAGVDTMKAASADREASHDGLGRLEEIAGKLTGCEGMEREGGQIKSYPQ